jgi:hypothetical protein
MRQFNEQRVRLLKLVLVANSLFSLELAAPHLTRLVRCNLSNCPLLDEGGVVAMAKYCKNLEHIFLSSSEKINDQAIIELTRGCKQLTTREYYYKRLSN